MRNFGDSIPGSDATWVSRYFTLDPEQPLRASDGVRLIPLLDGERGFKEVIHVAEGFDLVISNMRHEKSTSITSHQSDSRMKFHFRLSGTGALSVNDFDQVSIEQQTNALLLSPSGARKHEFCQAGEVEKSVTLICTRDYLRSVFRRSSEMLPRELRRYLSGKPAEYFSAAMPLQVDMASASRALIESPYQGAMRYLFAQAKSLELLFLSARALIEQPGNVWIDGQHVLHRNEERVRQARGILEENFETPPTISELSKQVGLSPVQLMRCFKQLFGMTVFDFAQALRMNKAKQLLEETDRTVTDIAFDVGYEYSSNFITAFKRHFGVTPNASRQRRKVRPR